MSMINDTDDDLLPEEDFEEPESEVEADEPKQEPEFSDDEPAENEPVDEQREPVKTESERKKFGEKVQKRINKLVREKRELENTVRQMQSKVESIEAKSTAREFSEFQQQISWSEQQVKEQLESSRQAYRKAVEEGDIDAQMAEQDKMLEFREQLTEKRRLSELAKEQAQKFQQESARPPEQNQFSANQVNNLPDGTRHWLKKNNWYMDGSEPKAAAYARQIDIDLQEEGFSPEDPSMYVELDRRLSVLVPKLNKASRQGAAPSQTKSQPRSTVAGSSADGLGTQSVKSQTRRLTSNDLNDMRLCGFDPNNSKHRSAWIKRNDPL